MIDGRPAATSLSPETHLADVQVEGYSRSLLVHHSTTTNHSYLSGSPIYTALCKRSAIKEMVKAIGKRITIKSSICRMTPLSVSSLESPRTRKNGNNFMERVILNQVLNRTDKDGMQSSRTLSEKEWEKTRKFQSMSKTICWAIESWHCEWKGSASTVRGLK